MDLAYLERRDKKGFAAYKLRKRSEAALAAIEKKFPGGRPAVLDIGACDGRTLSYIKSRLPGADCFGIEPDPRFAGACPDPRVAIKAGGAVPLPFGDASFDAVLMSSVIEHIPDLPAAMREVYRVLRPGGIVVIISVFPAYEWLSVTLRHKKADHFRNYYRPEVEELVKTAGLDVLESRAMPFWLAYNLVVGIKRQG